MVRLEKLAIHRLVSLEIHLPRLEDRNLEIPVESQESSVVVHLVAQSLMLEPLLVFLFLMEINLKHMAQKMV